MSYGAETAFEIIEQPVSNRRTSNGWRRCPRRPAEFACDRSTRTPVFSTYGYDENGNQITFTDANTHTTTNVFDALNRQTQTLYPDGTTNSVGYDADGRRVSQTNQDGIVTLFGYDGAGRLTSVTNALNQVTQYRYDEAGNEIAQIDALLRTNTFAYDGLGRRVSHAMPTNALVERFSYDLAGNSVCQTNFNGIIITNQYDEMNRLTNRSAADGYQVAYRYTPTGQRESMSEASGLYTYYYDGRDRLQFKVVRWTDGPVVTLNYGYDADGNVTNIWSSSVGGVTNVYEYDALNRLINVLDNGEAIAGYGFDNVGNLQSVQYGNGVTNLYQYDSLNRLTNLVWKLNASTLASFYYQLGATGNRTNLNEVVNGTNRVYAWQYDNLYRLTNETVSSSLSPTGNLGYVYDAVGNRTGRSGSLGSLGTQSFSYNANDWSDTDHYDSNGNTITNSNNEPYQYDCENRLTNYNDGTVVLSYDADGNRVKKITSTATTWYLVDDRNPSGYVQVLEEITASSGTTNLSRVYNYGLDLISQRDPGVNTNYYGYDGHGSVRCLLDLTGGITDTYMYDAFGTLVNSTGSSTANNYLYSGEQYDSDLTFYYLRARYLNPATGRFWTMDTYEGNNQDPLSLHKYLYVEDNPVNLVDPTGHDYNLVTTLTTLTIATTLGGLAIDYTVGYVAGANNGIPSGVIVNAEGYYAARGFVGGVGLHVLYDFASSDFYWSLSGEFGIQPLSATKKHQGGGWSLSVGLVWGMSYPDSELEGETTMTWPLSMWRYAPTVLSKYTAYNAMMQLARRTQHKELNTIQMGVFSSGGAWFAVGKRENEFALTVGLGSGWRKLRDLPESLKGIGDLIHGHLKGISPSDYNSMLAIPSETPQ